MKKMRYGLIVLWMLLCSVTTAAADVSIGFGFPNVSIGINLPLFPQLVAVPGYPVYYAPRVDANYFFYDGMYWVYQDDYWYASSWYNGPWSVVAPEVVPLYVLRIPVRYYRQPPPYFREWQANAPPRWGQHWGSGWEHQRRGWDRWDRRSVPPRAPQPVYQRRYSGDRYPRVEEQHTLRNQSYRYKPRDTNVRQHLNQQLPAQRGRGQAEPQGRNPGQPNRQQATQPQQAAPPTPRPQHQQVAPAPQRPQQQHPAPPQQREPAAREQRQHPGAEQREQQRQHPGAEQREQQAPRSQEQRQRSPGRGDDNRDRGQGHNRDEDRGRGGDDDRGRGRN